MKTRAELAALLDALEQAMPAMVSDHPDPADFWPAFAGQADGIEDAAGSGEDAVYVQGRIETILANFGFETLHIDVGQS